MKSKFVVALALCAGVAASQQVQLWIPDNSPVTNISQNIPFGASATWSAGYTFVQVIPASVLQATHQRIDEIAFMPALTGSWSCATVLMALGHVPNPIPCPFTFPGPGGATPGSFLDLAVIYDSATQGPFTWSQTQDQWSPLGFAALGGTGFVWNGVDDIAFFITFQSATVTGGACRRSATIPPSRTYAAGYQQTTSTACNATSALYVCLTMSPAAGLFADFVATPSTGAAPLTVSFNDASFTSDPGGVTTWTWDFQNDGSPDATGASVAFTYLTPGVYDVSLTVTDALHPSSVKVKTGAVVVGPYVFTATSSGGGVGDLVVTPVPPIGAPGMVEGFTFVSFAPPPTVGSGPAFGLVPDAGFWPILTMPAAPGNPLHYVVAPGLYPQTPFIVPQGGLAVLAGLTADLVQVGFGPGYTLLLVSNVARVTF
ncbi:MAG TPA: PKD domain-containing protein [Planctomycetota bacterium]|nr:PKD domain-containing protein [Planctomycetota bacterium]